MKPMKFIYFPSPVADDMVRAILDGHKTVTRRAVRPQPAARLAYISMGSQCGTWSYLPEYAWRAWHDESFRLPDGLPDGEMGRHWKPPYSCCDILYVRETWEETESGYAYKADSHFHYTRDWKWRPSIHMPRKAARIFLRVTNVRVERLQDITPEEARKEGVEGVPCDHPNWFPCFDCLNTGWIEPPTIGFSQIWDRTIKKADRALYGWDFNPWVWVIEFERINREEALKCG